MGRLGKRFGNVTAGQVFGVILFAFIFIQIMAKILGKWFPSLDARFGFGFQLVIVGFALYLMYAFIVTKKADINKKDFFVLLFMMGILTAIFFYLPKFLPEIFTFTNGNEQIQSFVGQIQSFIGGK